MVLWYVVAQEAYWRGWYLLAYGGLALIVACAVYVSMGEVD